MKRLFCLGLAVCLLLSGCGLFSGRLREPVAFYYLRAEYRYGQEDGVIVSEERDASGHGGNLSYLLALYLMGPSSDELVSPLPQGAKISSVRKDSNTVILDLTDTSQSLSDAEFSLTCACLTMTCLSITDAEAVTINSGERSITMTPEILTLYDDSAAAVTTEETQ